MKKYYKEWLKSLGVYEQYKANLDPSLDGFDKNKISYAFAWGCSTEGHDFWQKVYDRIYEFEKLIGRVGRIDPKAAKFLKKESWKTSGYFKLDKQLCLVMHWGVTPQGTYFWSDISNLINTEDN